MGHTALVLYIAAMPAVDAFAITPWTPVPLILALALLVLEPGWIKGKPDSSDVLLSAMLVLCVAPWLWSSRHVNEKALYHLMALATVIGVYYWLIRESLVSYVSTHLRLNNVFRVLTWSLVATSIFIIGEFLARNFTPFSIDSLVPYATRSQYDATVYAGLFRARGLAAESGHMGLFFDLAVPICLPRLLRGGMLGTLCALIVIVAVILLFSVATFAALLIGIAAYAYLRFSCQKLFIGVLAISVLLLASPWIAPAELKAYAQESLLPKVGLLWMSENIGSAAARLHVYRESMALLTTHPFGIGIGIAPSAAQIGVYGGESLSAGQVSLVATIGVAGGVGAILALLILQLQFVIRALRLPMYRPEVTGSIVALTAHYLVVGNYWFPFLWFAWALVIAIERLARRLNHAV